MNGVKSLRVRERVDTGWLWPVYFSLLGLLGTTCFRFTCQTQPFFLWIDLAIVGALLFGLSRLAQRRGVNNRLTLATQGWLALIVLWPLVSQRITRWFGIGDPFEITLLLVLQNAALCCAILGKHARLAQFSVIFSAFQLLFVGFLFVSREMTVIMALFGMAILWWLMEQYWSRTQGALPIAERRIVPFRPTLVGVFSVFVAGVLVLGSLFLPGQPLLRLAGIVPTSGGERWGDAFARDGSGSGDVLTGAVKNATTIAPVDTDVYVSSEQPSLYDMVSKAYGKPSKQKDKKISIDGSSLDAPRHEKNQELLASRQFATIRNFSEVAREHSERKSTALLFVSGEVPLHLRMETYSEFDGKQWEKGEGGPIYEFELAPNGSSTWFRSRRPLLNRIFTAHHFHDLQFVNLKTIRIPTPSLLCTWHVPQVDRHDFFEWTPDDVLQMKGREQIPATTKIGICSHGVDLYELYQHRAWPRPSAESSQTAGLRYLDFLPAALQKLPRGWQQVAAVETYFRSHFRLDSEYTVPENAADSVEAFLASGRGPDYLFASAAAMVLRELGYKTRFVQGLLADPKNYDRNSKLTIIWENGLHSWLEICVDDHNWIPLEVAPGFPLPRRNLTWSQSVLLWWEQTRQWLLLNWVSVVLAAGLILIGWWQRAWLADGLSGFAWRLAEPFSTATQVRWCERLIRFRLWAAGMACPRNRSLRQWLANRADSSQPLTSRGREFLSLLDRLRYGPGPSAFVGQSAASREACREILRLSRATTWRAQRSMPRKRLRILGTVSLLLFTPF